MTAARYWAAHGLNKPADAGDVDAITRAINGPLMLNATLRRKLTQDALAAFAP